MEQLFNIWVGVISFVVFALIVAHGGLNQYAKRIDRALGKFIEDEGGKADAVAHKLHKLLTRLKIPINFDSVDAAVEQIKKNHATRESLGDARLKAELKEKKRLEKNNKQRKRYATKKAFFKANPNHPNHPSRKKKKKPVRKVRAKAKSKVTKKKAKAAARKPNPEVK